MEPITKDESKCHRALGLNCPKPCVLWAPNPSCLGIRVLAVLFATLALGGCAILVSNRQVSGLFSMRYFTEIYENPTPSCDISGVSMSGCNAICQMHFLPLERQELRSLIMLTLAVFAQLRENGIEFVPNGGSFIGTVRHAGTIPWDNDADVWFLMNDTNLKKLQPNGTVYNALVARGFKVKELRTTNEFWVLSDYVHGKHVSVAFIPYCIRDDTVVVRCTLGSQKHVSKANFYPLIWVPFHTGFVSIPQKRELFWDEVVVRDVRESTMGGASFHKMMNWVAPTDHSSKVLIPIRNITYLQHYDPKDWDRTLPVCSMPNRLR